MIAGIDLGTTNSLIGVYESGFPTLLADAEGRRLIPSVVYYPENGTPAVGREGLRMQALHPECTIASAKRLIGRRFGEEGTQSLRGNTGSPVTLPVNGQSLTPEEVSSELLKKLKSIAEERLGTIVDRAVITVPAYFNDAQRAATRKAGELAGFAVERILSEPTAAALSYGLDRLQENAKVAVYDLGGGTFDLSVLQLDNGVFEVLSTHGDTRLGGDDLDEAIAGLIVREAGIESLNAGRSIRLKEAARAAKEILSTQESTAVLLPFLEGEKSLEIPLTRTQVEKVCAQGFCGQHVQCREGLVHQQNIRIDHQCAGKADTLAHSAGKLFRIGRFKPVQADKVDGLQGALAGFNFRHIQRLKTQFDVFENREPWKQRKALKHHGNAFSRAMQWRTLIDHLAFAGADQARNNAQERGFAAAGAPQQADNLALRKVERNMVKHKRAFLAGAFAVILTDIFNFKQRGYAGHDGSSREAEFALGQTK